MKYRLLGLLAAPAVVWLWMSTASGGEKAVVIPAPAIDQKTEASTETAVLAGGCFWGVQAVFQHLNGVSKVVSGYSGGSADDAHYRTVGSGRTGHAEAVEITFDPKVVSYGTILQVYFSVAHNPTELDRQGPDVGPQYRSEIFVTSAEQRKVAEAYVAQLDTAKVYDKPIATRIGDLKAFYAAEDYHQDYATLHPSEPYIVYNDRPKVENLKRLFPAISREKPVLLMSTPKS